MKTKVNLFYSVLFFSLLSGVKNLMGNEKENLPLKIQDKNLTTLKAVFKP